MAKEVRHLTRAELAQRAARELGPAPGVDVPALVARCIPPGDAAVVQHTGGRVEVVRPGGAPLPGPLEVLLLGAAQVSMQGDVARAAGAFDASALLVAAKRVVVVATHDQNGGAACLVTHCTLPVAGQGVAHRIITDLATLDVGPEGLVVREVAPGVSAHDVQLRTEPTLKVSPDLCLMPVGPLPPAPAR
jgi:acyl CoA:acetate/3-ketoacid CoA transferase beta subunit